MMSLVPLPQKVLLVANTTMFDLASSYLNDATQWNRIASSNLIVNSDGLYEPFIDAATSVKIPPLDPARGNGGILGG